MAHTVNLSHAHNQPIQTNYPKAQHNPTQMVYNQNLLSHQQVHRPSNALSSYQQLSNNFPNSFQSNVPQLYSQQYPGIHAINQHK